nr:translation initiation factor IF-2-like [Oryctolagus cuniculus]
MVPWRGRPRATLERAARAAAREWGPERGGGGGGGGAGAGAGRGRAGASAVPAPGPCGGARPGRGRDTEGGPAHAPIGRGEAGGARGRPGLGATSPARVVGAGLGLRLGPSPQSRGEGRAQADGAGDWRARGKTGKKFFIKQQMFGAPLPLVVRFRGTRRKVALPPSTSSAAPRPGPTCPEAHGRPPLAKFGDCLQTEASGRRAGWAG